MTQYQMPVRAIKNILKKELDEFQKAFHSAYPKFIMADVMKEMVYLAHSQLNDKLANSNTYDELEDYISLAGYRMSLEEWINSL